MDQAGIDAANAAFHELLGFRESFSLFGFRLQPHVLHATLEPARRRSGLHVHRTFEASLLLSGKVSYRPGGRRVEVREGQWILIPAGLRHEWQVSEEALILSTQFFLTRQGEGARLGMRELSATLAHAGYLPHPAVTLRANAEELLTEARVRKGGWQGKIVCLTRLVFLELFRALLPDWREGPPPRRNPPRRGATPEAVMELVHYRVQDHYAQELPLRAFAEELGLSIGHLCRLYRQATGKTVAQTLAAYRLERAKELLSGTDLCLAELAAGVGLADLNYFCRWFRKHSGMTPTQYRRGAGGLEPSSLPKALGTGVPPSRSLGRDKG